MKTVAAVSRVLPAGFLVVIMAASAAGQGRPASAPPQEGATWEDLSECKLPNAISDFPVSSGTQLGRQQGGNVFSFAQQKFSPQPKIPDEVRTIADFLKALPGDLLYAAPERGSFIVKGGRLADLGKRYLHEAAGGELARPDIVMGEEDGEKVPGLVTGIEAKTGHVFLIETADGKSVLLRIVSQDKGASARIQWVYQPDGSRKLAVPKGKILAAPVAPAPPPIGPIPPVAPVNVGDLDPAKGPEQAARLDQALKTHLENRKALEALCIKLVSTPPVAPDAQRFERSRACDFLGEIRSVAAAEPLAAIVDTNLALRQSEITVENSYRAVGALIRIGIPGAQAALKQIETDSKAVGLGGGERSLPDPRMEQRRNLLALVVLKVYGEKLAKVVLEDRIAAAKDDPSREALKKALEAFPRVKGWLPE